jgi:hypothetical protein
MSSVDTKSQSWRAGLTVDLQNWTTLGRLATRE